MIYKLAFFNQSRVRGSIKRRPPSRAHRKGPAANNPQTNTMTSSSVVQTPSNQVSFPQETNTRKLSEKVNESNPTVENQIFPSSNNEDDMFGVSEAKDINRIEKSSVKGYQASGEESRSASTPNQQAKMQAEVEDDLFSKPQGASSATKSKSLVKPFNQSQPTSLFGDDSDEDLFGVSNSRLSSLKATKSTAQQNIPKKEAKPAHSQSLFGDDEGKSSMCIDNWTKMFSCFFVCIFNVRAYRLNSAVRNHWKLILTVFKVHAMSQVVIVH